MTPTRKQSILLSLRLNQIRFGTARLMLLASLVGALSSLGVTLFLRAIEFVTIYYRQALQGTFQSTLGVLAIIPIVALGGLIVGFVMNRFIGEERHHGVAGIIEAAALLGGRLRYWRMPIKVTMAAVSLGAGASTGPEDPRRAAWRKSWLDDRPVAASAR